MQDFASRSRSLSRDLKLLWSAVFSLMFGFGVYSATFFNFITEALRIEPEQLGMVESLRETPGFLCVIVAALSMRIAEPVLAAASLGLAAVGMGAYACVNGVGALVVWSFVLSVGVHTWMPVSSSLVMSLAGSDEKGKRLGQTFAVGGLGAAVGMLTVMVVGYQLPFPAWFLIGGGASAVAAGLLLGMKRSLGHSEKPRLVWRRRYRLYYILTFLEGCRRQVFFTFAVFALTRAYHTGMQTIALLMVVNNLVNFVGGPIVGRLIDRIGEKRILLVSYTAVVLVFLGYATIRSAPALYVLYCVDNMLFLSTNCLTTFLQKIADPEDLMPSLSLGVTLNHTAAVLVPVIGAFLWARFCYPVTFFGGAAVAAVSLAYATKTGLSKTEQAP